ncbi:MAG TPA: FAD binding domain-containing protein [Gemmatimonadales bacterium]
MSVSFPASLPDALAILAERPEAVPVAGGTDLLVHWPARVAEHERDYVDLSGIAELKAIAFRNGELLLGALATYWDVMHAGRMREGFPLLVAAARQVGAVQIQARGTWGGNIANASPAADGVPVLMAYDAVVVLESATGGREEVPLDRFYTGYKEMRRRPDQLVVAIRIPWRAHDVAIFEKVGGRRAQAIAKVGLAIARSAAGWRVVAASVAPTVRRCPAIERLLEDGTAVRGPDDLLPAIARDVAPIDDLRSTAEYRKRVLARLLYYDLRGVAPAFS